MRLPSLAGRVPALLVALGGLLAAGPAAAVTVTCGTASGLAGQAVTVGLTTTDLTGLNVTAYQFTVTYDPNVVTATGVLAGGTLTSAAGWATPTSHVTSGRVDVSAAGAAALAGSGTLVNIRFTINSALLNGAYTGLTLSNFVMNEGTPSVTTVSGNISVSVTPQIAVSPNTGEIVRGSTIQFGVSGSVTNPVTWSTTNAGVATISGAGLLTGLAPGTVRVFAVDNAGKRDTTDGDILVRGMGVTVGTLGATVNQAVSVPVTVTSLSGLGVRSGEFQVSFNNGYLAFVSATRPAGTLLNGYGSMTSGASTNGTTTTVTVAFAGNSDLTGSGTLFDLNLATSSVNYGSPGLGLGTALFNETLPALRTNGVVNIAAPSSFTVNPNTVTLLRGQTQPFTLSGSPVLPVTWSTLDPTVATVASSGLLTAVAGGVTQVKAVDAIGTTAYNTAVTVYDFALTVDSPTVAPGGTVPVALRLDRGINGMGVYAVELSLAWSPTWVTAVDPATAGLVRSWGPPTVNLAAGSLRLTAAGSVPLSSPSELLDGLAFTVSPATPPGTSIPITLTATTFNEGRPIPRTTSGVLHVSTTTGVDDGADLAFALAPAVPNPARGTTRLAFAVPAAGAGGAPVRLTLYATDGRLVRTLQDGPLGAGRHEVEWDTRGGDGRPVPAGVYFYRLEWMGRSLERKLAVMR